MTREERPRAKSELKFQLGDKVRVLETGDEGVVIAFDQVIVPTHAAHERYKVRLDRVRGSGAETGDEDEYDDYELEPV